MLERIAILEPASGAGAELARAFEAALDVSVQVACIPSLEALERERSEAADADLLVVQARDATRGAADAALAALLEVRERIPDAVVVLALPTADADLGRRATLAGASDVLVLGVGLGERVALLLARLARLFDVLARNRRLDRRYAQLAEPIRESARILGDSARVQRLLAQVERVAGIPRPLLIVGERGTGKELVARAIHFASERREGAIVTVNCAALGDALVESELFGHVRGAFTGADKERAGRFEQADGGTLFLDEIGNLPLAFQQKILRVVEYGTYTRVGGSRERKTSARIVAATNADLREKIAAGEFLSDLYDRLAFEVIEVPPLRERPEDVETLALAFLRRFAAEIPAFRGKRLAPSALARLREYPFPGNVRELKNIIERAAYRDTTNEITPEDIGLLPRSEPRMDGSSFKQQVAGFSRELLERALEASGGNQAEAARRLGLSYDQFRHYRRKYRVGAPPAAGSGA